MANYKPNPFLNDKYGTAETFRCKMYIQTYQEYLKMGSIPCGDCGCVMLLNGWTDPADLEKEEPEW